MGEVFSSAKIDTIAFYIDSRCAPYRSTGGAVDIGAVFILALQRGFCRGVPLPHRLAVAGVQGDDAAVGFAANMGGTAGCCGLVGRHRYEQSIIVVADGAGDDRGVEEASILLPQGLERLRV